MFDIYGELYTLLSTLDYNVYYEDFVKDSFPCLSYYVVTSVNSLGGDTMKYDEINVRVTCWATSLSQANEMAQDVEELLYEHGFIRNSVDDLHLDDALIKKVLGYSCIARKDL